VSLEQQVGDLADLVRVLLALVALQLLVTGWLARKVSRLRVTVRALVRRVRELEGTVDNLDGHVREVLEPDIDDASDDAGRALEIVKADTDEDIRDFIKSQEKRRSVAP
jgi:hypothetical protein